LDGTDHYYLWQSDLEAGSFETPIVQDGPAPVTFATEAAARQYAATLGLPVSDNPPFLHDFDKLSAWCFEPLTEGADFQALGVAAGLLEELGIIGFDVLALPGDPDEAAADLYDKLMCALAVANSPESTWVPPPWQEGDPQALASLLAPAIIRLRGMLRRAV